MLSVGLPLVFRTQMAAAADAAAEAAAAAAAAEPIRH